MDKALSFSKRGDALIGQKMFHVLDEASRLEASGVYVYHLELGNPRLPPPPGLLSTTTRSLEELNVGYTYSAGEPSLRTKIADKFAELVGRSFRENNIAVSPANLIINQFLDLACDPGDKVVFFSPAFPTYWAAAAHIGLDVIDIRLSAENGFDLTIDDVTKALVHSPKAIIVNSANNPTGAVYEEAVLTYLAKECDRRGIWLMSDETYGLICFDKTFFSLAGYDFPRQVVMSSFSKIFSVPGFRVGFLLADPRVVSKFSLSTSTLISCLPIFTQKGCAAGIDVLDEYTAKVRENCRTISSRCVDLLGKVSSLKFTAPLAGFYFFLDIGAGGLSDIEFSTILLRDYQTAVTPGTSFGPDFSQFIRFSTCGNYDDVVNGVERIVLFTEQLTKN